MRRELRRNPELLEDTYQSEEEKGMDPVTIAILIAVIRLLYWAITSFRKNLNVEARDLKPHLRNLLDLFNDGMDIKEKVNVTADKDLSVNFYSIDHDKLEADFIPPLVAKARFGPFRAGIKVTGATITPSEVHIALDGFPDATIHAIS